MGESTPQVKRSTPLVSAAFAYTAKPNAAACIGKLRPDNSWCSKTNAKVSITQSGYKIYETTVPRDLLSLMISARQGMAAILSYH